MDENAIQQLWWARAQTITTFVGLLVIVMNVFSLMYDRIVRLKALDSGKRASDAEEMGPFRSPKLSSWSAFRGYITKTPRITTVSGLIEAGDDNLWSSAAVDHLQSQHGNLSWVPLYEAVYTQISKHHAADGRLIDATKDPAISLALQRSRLGLSGTGNERFRLHDNSKLINCLRHLDKTTEPPKEDNPRRGKAKGLTRLSNAWMLAGAPCVESSREELVSLALVLGVSLNINDFTQNISGVGPFGTGFDVIQDNGVWKLELIHGSRLPRHAASRSSGYSVLFAKHLAFGSLPFAENSLWVSSIYINPKVLQAIKAGHAIMDGKSFGGRPLQVLRSLAAAKQINAYYHTGDDELDGDLLGCITNSNNATVTVKLTSTNTTVHANWCRAVVGIAFGGLVPQASRDLSTAVAFTVGIDSSQDAIGDVVGDVVDALENLINNLHQCDSGANIFGDYVSERCEALQLIDFVHYATPSRYDTQEVSETLESTYVHRIDMPQVFKSCHSCSLETC